MDRLREAAADLSVVELSGAFHDWKQRPVCSPGQH